MTDEQLTRVWLVLFDDTDGHARQLLGVYDDEGMAISIRDNFAQMDGYGYVWLEQHDVE